VLFHIDRSSIDMMRFFSDYMPVFFTEANLRYSSLNPSFTSFHWHPFLTLLFEVPTRLTA
jgi:hypothetical protein